jgi:RND family efflux transporter MFP subunit
VSKSKHVWRWVVGGACGLILIGASFGVVGLVTKRPVSPRAGAGEARTGPVRVEYVHPTPAFQCDQPGSVISYESIRLFAQVSGYLKDQSLNGGPPAALGLAVGLRASGWIKERDLKDAPVDIGTRVRKADVLAVIDVPERRKQLERDQAAIDREEARIKQMDARIDSAKADQAAAAATVKQAAATLKSAGAWLRFRNAYLTRIQKLTATNSVEGKLLDEAQEQATAAAESENAAQAGTETAAAQQKAADAKLAQAVSDKDEAVAARDLAKADKARTQVMVDFATIRAPFDGVVTQRGYLPHDFIKSADDGGGQTPLLTVERTDKVRVVVHVPDPDVPLVKKGNRARVTLDELGKTFEGEKVVVSRTAESEDPDTRLMRVEIDLDNPTGEIAQGMYGQVQIWPPAANATAARLSVPSSCVASKEEGRGEVFVVRDGVARRLAVQLGPDNGDRVVIAKVLEGGMLSETDAVILRPGAGLRDGAAVDAAPAKEKKAGKPDGK